MSKDDSKPGGFFSKVVRLMRPTAESEPAVLPDVLAGSPDTLRQMLERKRRNDAVRQREFGQLRELRQQSSAQADQVLAQASGPSSGLHSSLLGASERAATLEKIDAIEDQMCEHWWRNKQPADASTLPMELMPAAPAPESVQFAAAAAWDAQAGTSMKSARLMFGEDLTTFAATELRDPPVWDAVTPSVLPPAIEFVHDADFEEAAVAFANGDVASAEASLLELLAQHAAEPDRQQAVWLVLFDLYRAADLGDRFALQAIDFVARVGRSAPLWFSLSAGWPAQAAPNVDGLTAVQPELAEASVPDCSLLGSGLAGCIDSDAAVWLAALESRARPGVPLVIDCSGLIRVDFAAAGAVLNWSAHMQAKGYLLRFDQLHRLVAVFFAMIGIHEHAQLVARSG